MASMLCRTKENANPRGKPRVYFTCHPVDFDRCFEKVCEDIFQSHDCAIYYVEDMFLMIQDQDLDTDLGSNNLFVIPVTRNLLTRPNRAMDVDLLYAQRKHIPVLPIMMEPDLDELYKKSYKFGENQYLNPYSTDQTEVPYAEKLKNYLESVLISNQVVKRIRDAFDTYIFLSYRKKDRHYANDLMRLIHRNPECWDIAIWYDEFLTPGESFQDSIQRILHDSKMFVLLVTPNLLEEPGGKPNFVMGQEYPAAQTSGIDILPVEMESTDQVNLGKKFPGIPQCIDAYNEAAFWERFLPAIQKITKPDNNNDPEHMFLIGLAYLDGIDVEVDRERGVELITAAAEKDYPEAMMKLHEMYTASDRPVSDHEEAGKWALRLAEYYSKEYGGDHELVLHWMQQMVKDWLAVEGNQKKVIELAENIYFVKRTLCGEDHPDTISALSQLAFVHQCCEHPKVAKIIQRDILRLCESRYGDKDPKTIQAMNDLAGKYGDKIAWCCWAEREDEITLKRIEWYTQVFSFRSEELGEKHEATLKTLADLAACYSELQDYKEKSFELYEKLYDLRKEVLGEKHPDTMTALVGLANAYGQRGDTLKKLELLMSVYFLHCEVDGEDHPDTLDVLWHARAKEFEGTDAATLLLQFAEKFREVREHGMTYRLVEQAYKIRLRKLGEEHLDTLAVLAELGSIWYYNLYDYNKALKLYSKLLALRSKVLGVTHPETIDAMERVANCYEAISWLPSALKEFSRVYELQCIVWGEEDDRTIRTLENRARLHYNLNNLQIAQMQYERVYALCRKIYGEDHYRTKNALNELETIQKDLEMNAIRWQKKVCQYCGGPFTGLFKKECKFCRRPKDY